MKSNLTLNQEFNFGAEHFQPGHRSGFREPFAAAPEGPNLTTDAQDAPAPAPLAWHRSPCGQETGKCDAGFDEQSIATGAGGRFKTG